MSALTLLLTIAAAPVVTVDADPVYLRIGEDARISTDLESPELRWYRLMPLARDYDNAHYCGNEVRRGCRQPIAYLPVELEPLRHRRSWRVREVPSLAREGTHRIVARHEPMTEELTELPTHFEIVVRRDDTYVGYLTELLGVPFVFLPGRGPGGHQTDRRLGADCVALVIYGMRRAGRRVPYVAPAALRRFAEPVSGGRVQRGSILHFGFQTAVVSRDRPPLGMLNDDDLIIHTFHGVAEEVPMSRTPYANRAVEVYRWPDSSQSLR